MSRRQPTRRSCIPRALAAWVALAATGLVAGGAGAQVMIDETVDPEDDGSQWAWSENLGWINAEPEGDGGPGVETRFEEAHGWLWSENAGWISAHCENTGSCGDVEYGIEIVTLIVEDRVELRSWAWSENAGWIAVACEATGSCGTADYGIDIEVGTGVLRGWAWSENAGWISTDCRNTGSCGNADYDVTIGPCPEITSITPNPAETGEPVTINGMGFTDQPMDQTPPKPKVYYNDTKEDDSRITYQSESAIQWNQVLTPGTYFVEVQNPNACLSEEFFTLVIVPPSGSSVPATNCGLLGIEPALWLLGLHGLRRRRTANQESNR